MKCPFNCEPIANYNRSLLPAHLLVCSAAPFNCRLRDSRDNQQCKVIVPRCMILDHELVCDFRVLQCSNDGCAFESSLIHFGNHEEICQHRVITCPANCGLSFAAANMDTHMANDCPLTQLDCGSCCQGEMCLTKVCRKDLQAHRDGCGLRSMTCLQCSAVFAIKNLQAHNCVTHLSSENVALRTAISGTLLKN